MGRIKHFDWESLIAIVVIALAGIGAVSVVRGHLRATIIVVPVMVRQAPDVPIQGDAPVQNRI